KSYRHIRAVSGFVFADPNNDEDTTSHRTPSRHPWQRWRRPACLLDNATRSSVLSGRPAPCLAPRETTAETMIETPRPTQRDETPGLALVSPVVSLIVGGESPQLRPVSAGPDGCPSAVGESKPTGLVPVWHRQPPQRASWRVPAPLESLTRHGVRVIRLALCPLRRRLPMLPTSARDLPPCAWARGHPE